MIKRKSKTILNTILAVFIAISIIHAPISNFAYAEVTASGTCGDGLTWELEDGTLTISGSGRMSYGTSPPWYSYKSSISTVIINEGVTSVGPYAFSACKNLFRVSLPESLTALEDCAFSSCGLPDIQLPGHITSMGKNAFSYCGFRSITIPDGVSVIGERAFEFCSNLTEISIGNSVTSIGEGAFFKCTSLESITLPDSIVTIGNNAFRHDANLTTVNIGKGAASIGNYAFNKCSSLTDINVDPGNNTFSSIDGVLFSNDGKKLIYYPEAKGSSYVIPSGVQSIEIRAFDYNTRLTSVTLPDSLLSIGQEAFYQCTSLTGITIPDGVTTIGHDAFAFCNKFTSVRIPASVTSLIVPFYDCTRLASVEVDSANKNYKSVDGVLLSKDGTSLIYFPEGSTKTVYTVPSGVKTIEESAMSGNNLTEINLPSSLVTIGDYSFGFCNKLTSITIPEGTTSIGDWAFMECEALRDITIPASVESMGAEVFYYCSSSLTIHGYEGSYAETYAKENNHNFSVITDDPSTDIPDARLIENIEGTVNKTGHLSFDFDETAFSNDSTEYDHTMGRAAAALSLLAYNKSKNILETVLKDGMGFTNIYTWDEDMQDDIGLYSPYMIGHKKVKLNGENTELVIVVIRGTYHGEWLDDFDSGANDSEGSSHDGFSRAEIKILDGLREYMSNSKYGFDKNAKMKILVTGHSRGAAVANLMGKHIDQDALHTEKLTPNDVFVYTFATPNTAVLTDRDKNSFKNIFNIVNPEDFVTKVIPSAWKYGRYGQTYVLPSKTTDPWESYTWGQKNHFVDIGDFHAKVKAGFIKLNGDGEYVPYPNGERELATYVKDVTKVVSTIHEYYYKNLMTGRTKEVDADPAPHSLHDLYRNALGGNRSGDSVMEKLSYAYIVDAATGIPYGGIGCETAKFFFDNQTDVSIPIPFSETKYVTKPRFAAAHMAETYYSAMNYLSKEQLMQPRKVLVGEAHCPVDVTIKDADGNVIGQIADNEVNESASVDNTAVLMSIEGEAKRFSFPAEADYTIEITGNDSGTMDYSLREEDPDTGEIKRVYYQDVPVTTSTVLTQAITYSTDVEARDLVDNEGNVVEPYAVIENGGIGDLSVEVTIEGKGSADSMYNLNLGDYVTLQAVTDEYNKFLGWYDSEGQLLSTEAEYGISMRENVALTAKFTENEKPDEPEPTPTPTPAPSVTPAPQAPAEIQDLPAVKISKPAAAKKSINVKWKKVSKKNQKKIQGIEIQVATDSGFTNIVKTATAGKKKTSKKIKGLTSKQTYYVRIRAYNNAADGYHVSAWKTKKIKVK